MSKNCCILFKDEITAVRLVSEYIKNDLNISVIIVNKKKVLHTYFKKLGIEILYLKSMNEGKVLSFLKKNKINFLTVNIENIISKKFFSEFKGKIFGVHGGILPKFRGKNSIHWMAAFGLKKLGSTLFLLSEKIDKGKIIKIKYLKTKTPTSLKELAFLLHYKTRLPLYSMVIEIIKKNKINKFKYKNKGKYFYPMNKAFVSLVDKYLKK